MRGSVNFFKLHTTTMSKATKKALAGSAFGLAARGAGSPAKSTNTVGSDFGEQLRQFGIVKEAVTLKHASLKGKEAGGAKSVIYFSNADSRCFRLDSPGCCLA